MWQTNLKVLVLGVLVLGFYTFVAQIIPQLQSEVPAALDLSGDLSPEVLVAAGDALFSGAGACTACHGLGTRAPNLRSDQDSGAPQTSHSRQTLITPDSDGWGWMDPVDLVGWVSWSGLAG